MPIFWERFALPLLVALLAALAVNFSLKLDSFQRVTGGLAILCAALFIGHTLQVHKVRDGGAVEQQQLTKPTVEQRTAGDNSPNISGNNNTVNITVAPPANNPPKEGHKTSDVAEASFLGGGFRESVGDADLVTVRVGGFSASNPRAWLKKGRPLIPYTVGPEQYSPISVGMDKNGKLLFTCTLVDGDESHPFQVQITNNVFSVASGLVQKNYNNVALEIADDEGVPLFQVIQESPNQLRINGVFLLGISPQTGTLIRLWAWDKYAETSPDQPKNFTLKPIFKYPSWKYLGQYAE